MRTQIPILKKPTTQKRGGDPNKFRNPVPPFWRASYMNNSPVSKKKTYKTIQNASKNVTWTHFWILQLSIQETKGKIWSSLHSFLFNKILSSFSTKEISLKQKYIGITTKTKYSTEPKIFLCKIHIFFLFFVLFVFYFLFFGFIYNSLSPSFTIFVLYSSKNYF